jgi:hypothetical protein
VSEFSRTILAQIRGNPKFLATTLVSCVAIGAAVALIYTVPHTDLISGALMGAAVSTAVSSTIDFLESPGKTLPNQFIKAAGRQLGLIKYYREYLDVYVTFASNDKGEEVIRLRFRSKLVPVNDGEWTFPRKALKETRVDVPAGLSLPHPPKHFLGGEIVNSLQDRNFTGSVNEELFVEYRVTDKNLKEYSDIHECLAPALGYDVYFTLPKDFSCEVHEIISDDDGSPVSRSSRHQDGEIHYSIQHAAFCRQGFRWKVVRES